MKKCEKCNLEYEDDVRFCAVCGSKLDVSLPDKISKPQFGNPQAGGNLQKISAKGASLEVILAEVNAMSSTSEIYEYLCNDGRALSAAGAGAYQDLLEEVEKLKKTERLYGKMPQTARTKIEDYIRENYKQDQVLDSCIETVTEKRRIEESDIPTDLWTWMKVSENKRVIFTEGTSNISANEFYGKLGEKLSESNVPVKMIKSKVYWDGKSSSSQEFMVQHNLPNNPFVHSVKYEHIGKDVFVDDKLFIKPPSLPQKPEKEIAVYAKSEMLLLMLGIEALVLSLWQIVGILISIGIIIWAYQHYSNMNTVLEHNDRCRDQENRWKEAWDQWQEKTFNYSFQKLENDREGHICMEISDVIDQVCNECYADARKEETNIKITRNELEAQIVRRRDVSL